MGCKGNGDEEGTIAVLPQQFPMGRTIKGESVGNGGLHEIYHDEDDIRSRKSEWTAEREKKRTRGCNAGVWHIAGYSAASAATAVTV